MSASEFYYACRNGELAKVKDLVTSMSTMEIDHIEPNGSTALHAAAYYGHIDVVRLLLDKGASPDQKNKYDKTPEEEASTREITQLFHDIKAKLDVDWTIDNVFSATSQHRKFYSFSQGPPTLSYVVEKLLRVKELCDVKFIRKYFNLALERSDAKYLITAYTEDSAFYQILDKSLACHNELTNEERENPPWFCAYARFLASDEPTLRPYRWTGITYNTSAVHKHQVAQWQVGKMMMNKAFLSTSRRLSNTKELAISKQEKNEHRSIFFTYIVNDDRAALDISSISIYPGDEEVLILPCMDFEVTSIEDSGQLVEITLLLR